MTEGELRAIEQSFHDRLMGGPYSFNTCMVEWGKYVEVIKKGQALLAEVRRLTESLAPADN